MERFQTKGIVLRRVDYGEADRIVTFLTPDRGTLGVMAKGVRKPKSKLAGGIELFSECDITLLPGKGDLLTLISSRLDTYYRHIVEDYDRVALGYEAIEQINRVARQIDDSRLYGLLADTLKALNDLETALVLIEAWFKLNLLALLGQHPDLLEDSEGNKLTADDKYELDPAEAVLVKSESGELTSNHIKTWRLLLGTEPARAKKITGAVPAAQEGIEPLRRLFTYQVS